MFPLFRKQAALLTLLLSTGDAFVPTTHLPFCPTQHCHHHQQNQHVHPLSMSSSSSTSSKKNIVIVSPPGGVGEVTAISSAKAGHSVQWFVVSPSTGTSLSLPTETFDVIKSQDGSLDITGGDADSLLVTPGSNRGVEEWIKAATDSSVDAVLTTLDDGEDEPLNFDDDEGKREKTAVSNAVKLVTQMACTNLPLDTRRVLVLPSPDQTSEDKMESENEGGLLKGLIKNPFAGDELDMGSLREALCMVKGAGASASMDAVSSSIVTLRYGELFGVPESNREATPFIGGPRRDPILREEYTQRSILLSPTNAPRATNDEVRSSRLSVADAAIQIIVNSEIPINDLGDVTLTSLRGSVPPTIKDWTLEFKRVAEMSKNQSGGDGSVLFETEYDEVPNVPKLADWIAYKWAPIVLGTYEVAGIRTGARPVYATRINSDNEEEKALVEIYWQQLVNFDQGTKTVGKMVITLTDVGIVATRNSVVVVNSGDEDMKGLNPARAYPGEAVLIRRLADAAGQAVDKGLAIKRKTKPKKAMKPRQVAASPAQPVSSTVTSSGSVSAAAPPQRQQEMESGPRTSGARRAPERKRGKRTQRKESGGKAEEDPKPFQ